ncbi:MAG TPA: hypothetical protein VE127_01715 [Solirubrobacteraceae bacterium]|nr:hypothetical protein [Solirubrobacteraceae bacterium]
MSDRVARLPLTKDEIAARARALQADGYGLYLCSNRNVLTRLNTTPFGLTVLGLDLVGPPQNPWTEADMMRVYNVLNATAFGDKGIPLQNWVMIDLGLLPSAFMVLTLPGEAVQAALAQARGDRRRAHSEQVLAAVLAEARRLDHEGPIPVAGYCAAPTPTAGEWVGWSLCSAIPGLGTIVKGVALEVYGARTLTGVAQFTDQALRVHRRFGPMEILAPTLDLHPVPHTMIYRTAVHGREPEESPTMWLDARDLEAQREMQARVDAGTSRYFILSPGLADGQVPILELTT